MYPRNKPCKALQCVKPRLKGRKLCYTHFLEQTRQKRIFSLQRAKERKEGSKKYQEKTRKSLHKKCWALMSQIVRRTGTDWQGNDECYTCRKIYHWKELSTGHFCHGKLDFDIRNLRKQCSLCNVFYNGKRAEYALRLVEENGLEWVKELKNDADQHPGYRLEELKLIHEDLKKKQKAL